MATKFSPLVASWLLISSPVFEIREYTGQFSAYGSCTPPNSFPLTTTNFHVEISSCNIMIQSFYPLSVPCLNATHVLGEFHVCYAENAPWYPASLFPLTSGWETSDPESSDLKSKIIILPVESSMPCFQMYDL